jgi:hypothetical protein
VPVDEIFSLLREDIKEIQHLFDCYNSFEYIEKKYIVYNNRFPFLAVVPSSIDYLIMNLLGFIRMPPSDNKWRDSQ